MFGLCKKTITASKKMSEIDLHKEALQALFTEYSCLRAEVQHDNTHQIQMATIIFSALVTLASSATIFGKGIEIGAFILLVVLPCFIMLMGLLWIDSIYRRVRSTCYTKILENKINNLLQGNNFSEEKIMDWEHWIGRLEDKKGGFVANRTCRSWLVAVGWLVAPQLTILAFFLFAGKSFLEGVKVIFDLCRTYCSVAFFVLIVYIIYYTFFVGYLKAIQKFPSKVS